MLLERGQLIGMGRNAFSGGNIVFPVRLLAGESIFL